MFDRIAPVLFVLIWSSGFIVARLVLGHAEPLTFLAARFFLAALVLAGLAGLSGAAWPRGTAALHAGIAGFLIHGLYLGAIFWAVAHGLPAGLAGLVAALQPLAVAALAGPLLGERVGPLQWLGIGCGFGGAALVLWPAVGGLAGAVPPAVVALAVLGVASLTAGTLYQKRFNALIDLRAGTALQYVGAAVPTALAAVLLEDGRMDRSWQTLAGLAWATLGLSVGAILLLMAMIERGAVSRVSALFFLVPAVTAGMAFLAFGERLAPIQLAGMVLAVLGVALASGAARNRRAVGAAES